MSDERCPMCRKDIDEAVYFGWTENLNKYAEFDFPCPECGAELLVEVEYTPIFSLGKPLKDRKPTTFMFDLSRVVFLEIEEEDWDSPYRFMGVVSCKVGDQWHSFKTYACANETEVRMWMMERWRQFSETPFILMEGSWQSAAPLETLAVNPHILPAESKEKMNLMWSTFQNVDKSLDQSNQSMRERMRIRNMWERWVLDTIRIGNGEIEWTAK